MCLVVTSMSAGGANITLSLIRWNLDTASVLKRSILKRLNSSKVWTATPYLDVKKKEASTNKISFTPIINTGFENVFHFFPLMIKMDIHTLEGFFRLPIANPQCLIVSKLTSLDSYTLKLKREICQLLYNTRLHLWSNAYKITIQYIIYNSILLLL